MVSRLIRSASVFCHNPLSKAQAILKYREEHGEFRSIEELMEVEGIKKGTFQKLKDQIKI